MVFVWNSWAPLLPQPSPPTLTSTPGPPVIPLPAVRGTRCDGNADAQPEEAWPQHERDEQTFHLLTPPRGYSRLSQVVLGLHSLHVLL